MSPKELMYIEDALGHETFLQSQCRQAAQALKNPELKTTSPSWPTSTSSFFRSSTA